jgi:mannose-6-phosphate isomerase-like protein (cupin superfamily)
MKRDYMKRQCERLLPYETKQLPRLYNYLAPDLSEIRLLHAMNGGGLAHCTLPVEGISLAVTHQTVEEIWYFLSGEGEVWRKQGDREESVYVAAGVSLTIPRGTHFQFRNTGNEPLCFIIATMPPWPGEQEAVRVQNYW